MMDNWVMAGGTCHYQYDYDTGYVWYDGLGQGGKGGNRLLCRTGKEMVYCRQ